MEGFFCSTSIREARPEDRQRDGGLGSGEGEPQRCAQGTRGTNFNWTREMVARDGIEPPTPAFSGLPSNYGKRFGMRANDCCERG